MAAISAISYVGTAQPSIASAVALLESYVETVSTGTTIRCYGISEVGPGRYWFPWLIADR
jgi:hypothetical protein